MPNFAAVSKEAMLALILIPSSSVPAMDMAISALITMPLSRTLSIISARVLLLFIVAILDIASLTVTSGQNCISPSSCLSP